MRGDGARWRAVCVQGRPHARDTEGGAESLRAEDRAAQQEWRQK